MRCTPAVFLILLLAGPVGARPVPPPEADAATVRGDSTRTRKRLAEIEQQILAGKTAGAADELQRVLDEAGDDLIGVDAHRSVPARRYVHRFLAQLPAAALAAYRDRIDEPARRLLEQGRAARDPEPLRRLIDRYFVSRPAEEALLLLGELAFERGQFRAAEGHWRRLTPDAEADEFPYPAPRTDPAAVRAKIVLAVVFQGDAARANELLETLRAKYPDAAGRLAGRSGNYADILAALMAEPPELPPDAGIGGWTTFGGNPSRDGRVGGRLMYHWPNRPTWATPIPRDPSAVRDRYPARPPPVGAARSVAFHPVVVGQKAYLADAGRVFGFDLLTGRLTPVYDIRKEDPFCLSGSGDLKLPVRFDADFTLTASGNTLFARLGSAALFPTSAENQPGGARRQSYLVCLDVADDTARVRWTKTPPGPDTAFAAWEGAPLVTDGRVIAAFARSDGGRTIHALACYDEAGRRFLWTAELTESGGPGGETRHRHELLTRAGPNVVFCSNAGAVVAVDVRTGKPAWAYRYPRVKKSPGESRYRDVNPPVAADGRVFVAPTDAEYLLALDAETGRLLWDAGPLEVDQVVGVASGKVVCTIAAPVRGIRGFDAATGSTAPPEGWAQHDDPGLSSFGRGLVSDEHVVWPTQAGLFVLRTRDGMPARQPIPGPHGNLAFADGVLLCATPTELWGFVPPGRLHLDAGKTNGGPGPLSRVDPTPATADELLPYIHADLHRRPTLESRPRPEVHLRPPVTVTAGPALPEEEPETARRSFLGPTPDSRNTSRTVVRAGDNHLAALDRGSGQVLWTIDSLGRRRFDPFAAWPNRRFLAPVYADDRHVVAFTADGRLLVLDAETGRVRHDQPGPAPEFVSTPVGLGGDRAVVSTGPSSVAAIDLSTGRTVWEYDAGRPASLMGTAPVIWTAAESLFVAVGRNHGLEIDRLRPSGGGRLWRAGPAFLPAADIDPAATAADTERLYVHCNGRLVALRLDTGREAWDVELPALQPPRWVAWPSPSAVIILPTHAVAAEPLAVTICRLGRSFLAVPTVRRLPGLVATLYDAWIDRSVPVLLLDPATGRQLQRLDLPARGPSVTGRFSADGLVVTTGGATYHLK